MTKIWKAKHWLAMVSLAAVVVTCVMALRAVNMDRSQSNLALDTITFYHPYRPLYPMDPRAVATVGDQVLSEHVFAFHSRESVKAGFQPIFSDVKFDHDKHIVTIIPRFSLVKSDGSAFPIENICASIAESFKGTQHAPYRSLFISARCQDGKAIVRLKKIPVNLRFLFTMPDFSIYEANDLPIDRKKANITTGPYSIETISEREVGLRINSYFPAELRANSVPHATYKVYESSQTTDLILRTDATKDHLLYLYGHVLTESDAAALKKKGYRLNFFPSEWFAYIGFNSKAPPSVRQWVADIVWENQESLLGDLLFGQRAFSIAPSDRPFGLDKTGYESAATVSKTAHEPGQTHLTLGVMEGDNVIPFFRTVMNRLIEKIPGLSVRLFKPIDVMKMTDESDIQLSMIGISPADPLNHLAFLWTYEKTFSEVLSEERITQVAQIDNANDFISAVKQIETEVAQKHIIVPLAHFPGVVAEAPGFERDESLAWSWGTQAWTYRIR